MMNEMGETRYSVDATLSSYPALFDLGNGSVLTISNLAWIFWLIAALLVYVTTSTKFGKRLYALGSNEKAAGFAGINVELTGSGLCALWSSGGRGGLFEDRQGHLL